jgi:fatty-acyl-CoA synthase
MRIAETLLLPPQIAATLLRAGLFDLRRPDLAIEALRLLRRWGATGSTPFIGALRSPDRDAVVDDRGAVTFGEINERTNALANAWKARGIGDGDAVGILCRNHRGLLEASFAAAKLGADAIFLNTMFAAPQVAEVCARERIGVLVYDDEFESSAAAAAVRSRYIAWEDDPRSATSLERLIAEGDRSQPGPPRRHGRLVLLSSGTTGAPKGARRSKPKAMTTAAAVISKIPLRAHESTMIASPIFHGLGFLQASLALGLGSTMVLRRRFEPAATLAAVERHRCTGLVLVPVMLQRILDLPREAIDAYDLTSLRIIVVAGSNLSADLGRRALDRFGDVVYNLYGSTEVAWATIATPADLRASPGCAGRPPLGTTVRLYDDEGRAIHRCGERGRIFVGSGMPFEGYTGGETKLMIDGLMSTGDVGHFDEGGRLFVDGREDAMIVSGGENVFPDEIEDCLSRHDAIAEAAVVGVADPEFGHRLRAFVVSEPGRSVTEEDLKQYVKRNLASYKVPRDVVFLDALPRNATGKVLKRALGESGTP